MKKEYESPKMEAMEIDYKDTVTASNGGVYRLYTDGYKGCREKETDEWMNEFNVGNGNLH